MLPAVRLLLELFDELEKSSELEVSDEAAEVEDSL